MTKNGILSMLLIEPGITGLPTVGFKNGSVGLNSIKKESSCWWTKVSESN